LTVRLLIGRPPSTDRWPAAAQLEQHRSSFIIKTMKTSSLDLRSTVASNLCVCVWIRGAARDNCCWMLNEWRNVNVCMRVCVCVYRK
jgi:hypothetical protein